MAQKPDTWKDQLLKGAAEVFATSSSARPSTPKVDIKVLHAKIGELTLENDFLDLQNRLFQEAVTSHGESIRLPLAVFLHNKPTCSDLG
jgi:hypothetical protein